jgi:glutathione S-transferase
MLFLSANVYDSVLRIYYPDRYSTAGPATATQIKDQGLADYMRHLELIHGALSPYVLGEKLSAADPYLHMLAAWYPGDLASLHARLPKLAKHAELLRRRPATLKAEQAHTDG